MKKHIISLMLGAVVIAMNPAFGMHEDATLKERIIIASPPSILKDVSFTEQSEEIASDEAFRSVIQLEIFHNPLGPRAPVGHSHRPTGLVIHPHGILSCARVLSKDLLQDIEEVNLDIFKARLKYPLFIHSNPNKEITRKFRNKNCSFKTFVYFSRDILKIMPETCPCFNTSHKQNNKLNNDFAFFHFSIKKQLNVVNLYKIYERIYTNNFPEFIGFPTCSFHFDQTGDKKQFSIIENKYPLSSIRDNQSHLTYLLQLIDSPQYSTNYPALLRLGEGTCGSPVFVQDNDNIMLLGLLNAGSNNCTVQIDDELKTNLSGNLITPIRKFDSSEQMTIEMTDIFTILYESFLKDMERKYGYDLRIKL